jgi:hypothetical protein
MKMGVLEKFESAMPFLLSWLHRYGSVPIRYRLLTEIEGYPLSTKEVREIRSALKHHPPAMDIIKKQRPDGSWGGTFRGTSTVKNPQRKSPFDGIEYQFSRLAEMGFDRDNEPIKRCAELLKMYIVNDPRAPIWEARYYLPDNPEAVKWHLRLITIISAKMLSMAGYQEDEALKKWMIGYIAHLNEYLESDRSKNPYTFFKGKYAIDEEIMLPGYHLLDLLAFNPWLKVGLLGKLFFPKFQSYISNFPKPPEDCPMRKYISINCESPDLYIRVGDRLYRGQGIPAPVTLQEVGTKYKNHIPSVLKQLEMRARLGFLERDDPVLLWFLSNQDKRGIISIPGRLEKMIGRDTYHYYPLNDTTEDEGKFVDATFRAFLIVHYLNKASKVRNL